MSGSGWRGGGEELEGVERRKTVFRLHCMKKQSMYNEGGVICLLIKS